MTLNSFRPFLIYILIYNFVSFIIGTEIKIDNDYLNEIYSDYLKLIL